MNSRGTVSKLIMATAGLMAGCGASTTIPLSGTPTVPDVYVAGWGLNSAGVKVATVWKNGVATSLTDGSNGATANSVAVSGADVYVSGAEFNGSNGNSVAMLWKNGVATALTDGTLSAGGGQVEVSGTDVYVTGGWSGYDAQGNYVDVQGYWKNGTFIALLTATNQGQKGAGAIGPIIVQAADVYVAGVEYEMTPTGPGTAVFMPVAIYWKNGTPVTLTDGMTLASVTSMAVAGSDVYVAGGHCFTLDPDCLSATYWKNGVETVLSTAQASVVSGIAAAGTNVYASGNTSTSGEVLAQFWTNGTPTTLTESSEAAANGAVIQGADVYVVGAEQGKACYWKNGVLNTVSLGGYTSTGSAIAVVQP
jgi:hypothetical protein